jgi:hypothetical protein
MAKTKSAKTLVTAALKRQARKSLLALEKAHKDLDLHIRRHKKHMKAMSMFAG